MNIKLYILDLLNEINNKIRYLEDLGRSNNLDISKDTAYIVLVSKRETLREILNYMEQESESKITGFFKSK